MVQANRHLKVRSSIPIATKSFLWSFLILIHKIIFMWSSSRVGEEWSSTRTDVYEGDAENIATDANDHTNLCSFALRKGIKVTTSFLFDAQAHSFVICAAVVTEPAIQENISSQVTSPATCGKTATSILITIIAAVVNAVSRYIDLKCQ